MISCWNVKTDEKKMNEKKLMLYSEYENNQQWSKWAIIIMFILS